MLSNKILQDARGLIEKSTKIFLAFPPFSTPDTLAAAEIIAGTLARLGKEVGVSGKQIPEKWEFLSLSTLQNANTLSRELYITLDTKQSPVGELRYEKEEEALTIVITPKTDSIDPGLVRVTTGPAKVDCIITLGIESLDDLGTLYQKNPRLFFETPVLAFGISPAHDGHGEVNMIDVKASALTEVALQFFKLFFIEPLSKESATLILAGILSNTNNFLDGRVSPETLEIVSESLRAGGEREKILECIHATAPLPALHLFGRAAARSRMHETLPVLISLLTKRDFEKTGATISDIPFVLKNLEDHLVPARAIVLLFEEKEGFIRAEIRARDTAFLRELHRALGGKVELGVLRASEPFSSFETAERELLPTLSRIL